VSWLGRNPVLIETDEFLDELEQCSAVKFLDIV